MVNARMDGICGFRHNGVSWRDRDRWVSHWCTGPDGVIEIGAGKTGAGKGAGDHDAALLTGGHLSHELPAQVFDSNFPEEIFGAGPHGIGDGEIGPEG